MDEEIILMARLHFGDADALTELYARLGPHVYALSHALLHSREEAEEVLQDIFARLSSGGHGYRPVFGSPRAFIYTMARNASLSRLRARGARPVSLDPDLVSPDLLAARQPDLDTRVTVQGALERLTDHDQALILDAFFQGLSHLEIAARRQMPLGTVKTRLRRALLTMRRRLEEA
ncbi:sigma-70 family RNA polymerase sigma factor (plasmid) [Deinococcus radiomollis]|uniref:RNA polymerase sigma factor n=1 Tax=Deinococcus radiomollis TaxID=468916 RepID=UPI003891D02D